jgi:hypothetical protein
MLVDCRIAEYSKHFLRVPGDLRLQLQRASLDDTHVRSNDQGERRRENCGCENGK